MPDEVLLIAPCGMNCGICMAYLRERNKCSGCRMDNTRQPITRKNCRIKNCCFDFYNADFCFECGSFPCDKLKHLDKRYRLKYNMSMMENLEYIKKSGIEKFIRKERMRWKCTDCGGTICVHKGVCINCGTISMRKK